MATADPIVASLYKHRERSLIFLIAKHTAICLRLPFSRVGRIVMIPEQVKQIHNNQKAYWDASRLGQ